MTALRRPHRPSKIGTCETCAHQFSYDLLHDGFNESAYAVGYEMAVLVDKRFGRKSFDECLLDPAFSSGSI